MIFFWKRKRRNRVRNERAILDEVSLPALQFGLAGISMIIVYKALDLLKLWWLSKDGKNGRATLHMTRLACQTDPMHFERIKAMGEKVENLVDTNKDNEPAMKLVRDGIGSGAFSCAWTREEVLRQVIAFEDNTSALKDLTQEIRIQNGR